MTVIVSNSKMVVVSRTGIKVMLAGFQGPAGMPGGLHQDAVDAAASAAAAATSAAAAAADRAQADLDVVNAGASNTNAAAQAAAASDSSLAAQGFSLTAIAQASLAAAYAASASSVVQQDLSGITAQALHRSPNIGGTTSLFVYDVSKDSDGGAWVDRCQHTSWYNEALNGAWLGAQVTELAARGDNLLSFPEAFDDATWTKSFITVTANSDLGNDGTTTADTLTSSSSTFDRVQKQLTTFGNGVVVSISTYMKAGTANGYLGYHDGAATAGTRAYVKFDLGAGTVSGTAGGATGTISPASNGLYLCTMNFTTLVAAGYACMGPWDGSADSSNMPACASGKTVKVWGAKAKVGAMTAYVAHSAQAGQYFQLTTDGKFYALGATYGTTTEVFRGNTAKFPRLAAIVAESSNPTNLTIYDLTQPGRPMWMRLAAQTASYPYNQLLRGSRPITSVAALNGQVCFTNSAGGGSDAGSGLSKLSFINDSMTHISDSTTVGNVGPSQIGTWPYISQRNSNTLGTPTYNTVTITNSAANLVAMTVLKDAPVDASTGLPVPAIAVANGPTAGGGGISVLRHDGTVASITGQNQGPNFCYFTKDGKIAGCGNFNDALAVYPIPTANVSWNTFVEMYGPAGASPNINFAGVSGTFKGLTVKDASASALGVEILKRNPSTPAAGAVAIVNPYYATGFLVGDARRSVMTDTGAGTSANTNLVTNGTFDTDTSGWTALFATTAVTSGVVRVTADGSGGASDGRIYRTMATVAGRTYRITGTGIGGNTAAYVDVSLSGGSSTDSAATTGTKTINAGASGTFDAVFTATGTLTSIILHPSVGTVGNYADFDNIVVAEVVGDRSYKGAKAAVNGTLARTAVAAAAQLVAYSGFSNDAAQATELVTNGAFAADLSGWTVGTGITWSAGAAAFSAGAGYLEQMVTTVAGRAYTVTATAAGGTVFCGAWDSAGQNGLLSSSSGSRGGTFTFTFTAADATSYIAFNAGAGVTLDNVSVKPANALGSAANAAQETAYSSDLDVGTAAWQAEGWFNVATTGFGPQNAVRNSASMSAVVAGVIGSGGVMPTNWGHAGGTTGGLTATVIGSGTESGMPYFEIRYNGTSSTAFELIFEASNVIAASASQQWTASNYVKLSAGASTNLTGVYAQVDGIGGSAGTGANTNTTPTGAIQRLSTSYTLGTGATNVRSGMVITPNGAVDFTLRVYVPQIERGPAAALPIQTTGTAFNGLAPIIDRSWSTGAYWRLGLDGNGFIAAEAYDGTTTRRVTSTTTVNHGDWVKAQAQYTTDGALTLLLNGKQNAQVTGAALLTLNNANALATYGNNFALNAAFPGSIALVRVGVTVPSANQAQFIFDLEKEMFRAGAQVTLPDTGNVLDIAYDDMEDKLRVVSAANESSFVGLVRVSSAPVSAGSFTRTAARSGVKLLARSTTTPGVDVTIPAYGLREEMYNRAERAASLARLPQPFDFDATTGQTDFALPVGYETLEVISAGASKREGATKDWTRRYDGFVESVRFGVAPGNAAWVQLLARRAA